MTRPPSHRSFFPDIALRGLGFPVLAITLLLISTSAAFAAPGDVNEDGAVDRLDAELILGHLLGDAPLSGASLQWADANEDGAVDVGDLVWVVERYRSRRMIVQRSVAGGAFTMGARDDGDDATYAGDDERPRHEVTLSPYLIGKHEITNGQVCEVFNRALAFGYLEDQSGGPYSGGNVYAAGKRLLDIAQPDCQISFENGQFVPETRDDVSMADHPVVEVSWFGAVCFCNWQSLREGRTPCYDLDTWTLAVPYPDGYRLPTEAEWERAAAWDGAAHRIYGFGADTLAGEDRCNYWGPVNPLGLLHPPYTAPVGWFDGVRVSPNGDVATVDSPSPAGAYDMSGNVWEWCHDWYSETYYAGSPAQDPTGPGSGSFRALRGGAWSSFPRQCRTAERDAHAPLYMDGELGFRVARTE